MGGLSGSTLILARKYTADTADTLGSLRGANCTIENIVENADKSQSITFKWTGTSGNTVTQGMTVPPGVSVVGFTPVDDDTFTWDYSDGTHSDPVDFPSQVINISEQDGNAIIQKDDGLYVPSGNVEISTDEGNLLESKENGLFVGHDEDKLDIDQGVDNAGKALIIGPDGKLIPGDAGVKVSSKDGNDIEIVTDAGQEGIFVSVPVKAISVEGTAVTPDEDGNANIEIPISEEEGNIIVKKDDGIFAAKGEITNEDTSFTYEEMFDETADTPYHGSAEKQVESAYLYSVVKEVVEKIQNEIDTFYDITQDMQYITYDDYAALDAVDLTTFTDGIIMMLVKQDENYPRPEDASLFYTTLYILVPKSFEEGTTPTLGTPIKLNISEKMISNQIEKAIKEAIYISVPAHYEISADPDALEVVADGTLTDADTEIEESNVTPILPGVEIAVGDMVKFVDESLSSVTKFIKRDEVDITLLDRISVVEVEDSEGNKTEHLAFDGSRVDDHLKMEDVLNEVNPANDSDSVLTLETYAGGILVKSIEITNAASVAYGDKFKMTISEENEDGTETNSTDVIVPSELSVGDSIVNKNGIWVVVYADGRDDEEVINPSALYTLVSYDGTTKITCDCGNVDVNYGSTAIASSCMEAIRVSNYTMYSLISFEKFMLGM